MTTEILEKIEGGRVTISASDALQLRAKVRGMKRAAENIRDNARQVQENAKRDIQWCLEFEQILNLIIRTDEP